MCTRRFDWNSMYYFVYYISILLNNRKADLIHFLKGERCDSFMTPNRRSHMSAADWLFVVIRFFSVVEILIKLSALYNKHV